jgi:hypothetical protein
MEFKIEDTPKRWRLNTLMSTLMSGLKIDEDKGG